MSEAHKISRRHLIASGFLTATWAALPCPFTAGAVTQSDEGDEMNSFMPYLLFDGKCRQAMEFYKTCFGGELSLTQVGDSPAKDQMPPALHDKVVHARLKSGNIEIAASDWLMPNRTPVRGNTLCLFLGGGTLRELKSLFEKLSDEAEVTDPLEERFFGTYGALNDKFGVRWMFQTTEKA